MSEEKQILLDKIDALIDKRKAKLVEQLLLLIDTKRSKEYQKEYQ